MCSRKEAEDLFHAELDTNDPQCEALSAEHGGSCQLVSRLTNMGEAEGGIQNLGISVASLKT